VLSGVIWYRLPVKTDSLNWSWSTLASVMEGREPKSNLRAETSFPRPGLLEVTLTNCGDKAATALPVVELKWREARMVGGDGLGGYRLETRGTEAAYMIPIHSREVKPGERRKVGWLRLNRTNSIAASVTIEML